MTKKNLKLVDTEKPDLYREIFPYTKFPKVVFDDNTVPYDLPGDTWMSAQVMSNWQKMLVLAVFLFLPATEANIVDKLPEDTEIASGIMETAEKVISYHLEATVPRSEIT